MANKVELYNNGTLIGTDNAPTVNGLNWIYSIPYTTDPGNDVLTAKAFIDNVEVASSGVRNVVVNAAGGGGGSNYTGTGTVDPDYEGVLNAVVAAGDPLPDSIQQTEDNNEIKAYKLTGSWATDDSYLKFEGTAPTAFKRYCWKRKIKIGVSATGLTWSATGVEGNGTTGYLDTLIAPSQCTHYTQNNAGILFKSTKNPIETKTVIGSKDMVNNRGVNIIPNRAASPSNNYWNINQSLSAAAATAGSQGSLIGLNGLYRIDASTIVVKKKDNTVGGGTFGSNPSAALSTYNFYLLAQNEGGTPNLFSTERLGRVIIGANKSAIHVDINSVIG